MKQTSYPIRHIVRLTLEARTPLAVGSGRKSVETDSLVVRDINGLPYIPATSLAGVLRHALLDEKKQQNDDIDQLFGYQGHRTDDGQGSRIIFTDALLTNEKGEAVDGLTDISENEFLLQYAELPIRQHARINGCGTVADTGKFDNQVVFRGSRFVFEMEIVASAEERATIEQLLEAISQPSFRLGGGTTCGYGAISVKSVMAATLDLTKTADLDAYLAKPASLSASWARFETMEPKTAEQTGWDEYTLTLRPCDFFLFGSGFGDDEADMTPVSERVVTWSNGMAAFTEQQTLIPATSLKGALAHRTAYHYNRIRQNYADKEDFEKIEKAPNEAVTAIFGKAGDEKDGRRGSILLEDLYLSGTNDKLLNHVAIDKFTGGVMDGALFTEKATTGRGLSLTEHIYVRQEALADPDIRTAFQQALRDIADGLLPLGGGVNRGHGTFTGTITLNETSL